jgi:membrane-bound ClpP family serine protease
VLQTILALTVSGAVAVPPEFADPPDETAGLGRIAASISPRIEGVALIIEGRIDSHIYDYIQYEAAKAAMVRVIDLDSLGGNAEWALEIARKIKELGKTTQLRSQHVCASACATIFAAGRERMAAGVRATQTGGVGSAPHPVLRATFYPRRREIAASPR